MSEINIDKTIDARSSFCPGPLMELIRAIKESEVGTVIEVLSSDEGSTIDIPAWVEKAKQQLIGVFEKEGYWSIVVKKVR